MKEMKEIFLYLPNSVLVLLKYQNLVIGRFKGDKKVIYFQFF
jgi:hypothetical protein